MEYAKVNIKAKGKEFPYQTGGTDTNGRFCFVPDHEGQWTIVANDGMGHRQELNVQVNMGTSPADMKISHNNKTDGNSRLVKGLCGLSIIFGFTGILAWYRSRNRTSVDEQVS
jgi:nickel transport protein